MHTSLLSLLAAAGAHVAGYLQIGVQDGEIKSVMEHLWVRLGMPPPTMGMDHRVRGVTCHSTERLLGLCSLETGNLALEHLRSCHLPGCLRCGCHDGRSGLPLAFRGSRAAHENEGASLLEGWGTLFPALPSPSGSLSGDNLDDKREAGVGGRMGAVSVPGIMAERELASQPLVSLLFAQVWACRGKAGSTAVGAVAPLVSFH